MDWYRRSIDLRGQVVVDVGANVGHLSQFFFEAGDDATRLLSIEPLPANLEQLRKRVEAAGSPRWTLQACAVSDREGTGLLRSSHSDEHGHDAVLVERPRNDDQGLHEVQVRRLSALAPDATVVKLDVEGHEYCVLDEALGALTGATVWAIEFHMRPDRPLPTELRRLADHGYGLFAAGQRPGGDGSWRSFEIDPRLDWPKIPVAGRHGDGTPFKMLHVLATR